MISRCFCESTSIEISGTAEWVAYCHCEDCRRATSAPVTAYASYKNNCLVLKSGTLQYYKSSPGVRWGSCSVCNAPMTYESEKYEGETDIHLITIDRSDELPPKFHVHCREAVRWLAVADELPRHEGSSDGG